MPTLNVPLLRDTLTFIRKNQDKWDQQAWAVREDPADPACGTAYCLAGHVVVRSGLHIAWVKGQRDASKLTDGRYIDDVAAELLGLESDWSEDGDAEYSIFAPDNSLADLWNIAEDLSDGEIQRPATV